MLYEHQLKAIQQMHNGCILNGDVGSGKSRAAIAYYYLCNGGSIDFLKGSKKYIKMKNPKNLIIITTAQKRDKCEWDLELAYIYLSPNKDLNKFYSNNVIIDSWNNIPKYANTKNSFFILDEQRVIGGARGTWVKSFLKIAKANEWILLSATPGDTWKDYAPIFIANGFYKNFTDFNKQHVIFSPWVNYPKIDRYINIERLIRLRDKILVDMEFERKTIKHKKDIMCNYDRELYKKINKDRWNIYKNSPIESASDYCFTLRKLVNSDPSRAEAIFNLHKQNDKLIIFYNFDYERDILLNINYDSDVEVREWNGHKHQEIPNSTRWVYLVQYTSGCEGWNCIKTNTIVFYSLNYSYKVMHQAEGRIDRLNTPFIDLYYYELRSSAPIDMTIRGAYLNKKKFNEGKFYNKFL